MTVSGRNTSQAQLVYRDLDNLFLFCRCGDERDLLHCSIDHNVEVLHCSIDHNVEVTLHNHIQSIAQLKTTQMNSSCLNSALWKIKLWWALKSSVTSAYNPRWCWNRNCTEELHSSLPMEKVRFFSSWFVPTWLKPPNYALDKMHFTIKYENGWCCMQKRMKINQSPVILINHGGGDRQVISKGTFSEGYGTSNKMTSTDSCITFNQLGFYWIGFDWLAGFGLTVYRAIRYIYRSSWKETDFSSLKRKDRIEIFDCNFDPCQ